MGTTLTAEGHNCSRSLIDNILRGSNRKIDFYITIILSLVLYEYESWLLTMRDEHRPRVFENRVVRKIFGSKGDEVKGYWRKLHNEELSDVYSSPIIARVIKLRRKRWAGHLEIMG